MIGIRRTRSAAPHARERAVFLDKKENIIPKTVLYSYYSS